MEPNSSTASGSGRLRGQTPDFDTSVQISYETFARLSKLESQDRQKSEVIKSQNDKISELSEELRSAKEEFKKETKEIKKAAEDTKVAIRDDAQKAVTRVTELLGIFVALFTFVSIQFQVLPRVGSDAAISMSLISLGGLLLFVLALNVTIKFFVFEEPLKLKTLGGLLTTIMLLIALSSIMYGCLRLPHNSIASIEEDNTSSGRIDNSGGQEVELEQTTPNPAAGSGQE